MSKMSSRTQIQARITKPNQAISTATLGWLALVPVLIVFLQQALSVGTYATVASAIPVFDGGIWASCASALSHGQLAYDFPWCLRRPLTVVMQAPLYWLAPNSLAAVVLVQTLAVSVALWGFMVAFARVLPITRLGILVVYCVGGIAAVQYGTYMGPEGLALALSFASAACVLMFISTRATAWGLLAVGGAVFVLQLRPGNFLVVFVIAVGMLVMLRRSGRKWLFILVAAAAIFGVLILPPRLMQAAGWHSAGHAANFWSAAYAAATPEIDTWTAAYDRFGSEFGCPPVADWNLDLCLSVESEEFGKRVLDATMAEIQEHPEAIARQIATNGLALAREGYLNNMLRSAYPARWQVWKDGDRGELLDGWNGLATVAATLLWYSSLVLASGMVVGVIRLGRRGSPFEPPKGDPNLLIGASLWIGLSSIMGAFCSYALIGLDDPQRHLIQGLPYLLIGIGGLAANLTVIRSRQVAVETARTGRRGFASVLGVILIIIVGAVVEGRGPAPSVVAALGCTGGPSQEFVVVAEASVNTHAPLRTTVDWRRFKLSTTQTLLSPQSETQRMLDALIPGQILLLRGASGDLYPVFLADDDQQGSTELAGVWCVRTPSDIAPMIVRDLIPTAGRGK